MDENKKYHRLIEGEYACPEFASQKLWRVQEKIDGTNVRICFTRITKSSIAYEFKGRNNESKLPKKLLEYLRGIQLDKFIGFLPQDTSIILFGEGFGEGIQNGERYRPDISFILFDVYLNKRWASREEVSRFAEMLNLETPYDYGLLTQEEIISLVKSNPNGHYGNNAYTIEGIIARSEPLVRFHPFTHIPVMWKLKVKDFSIEEE